MKGCKCFKKHTHEEEMEDYEYSSGENDFEAERQFLEMDEY